MVTGQHKQQRWEVNSSYYIVWETSDEIPMMCPDLSWWFCMNFPFTWLSSPGHSISHSKGGFLCLVGAKQFLDLFLVVAVDRGFQVRILLFHVALTLKPVCISHPQGDARRSPECLMWIGKTGSAASWTSRTMPFVGSSYGDTSYWILNPTTFSGTWTIPR